MSDLIVIGYDNPQTARQAYEQVQRLQQDFRQHWFEHSIPEFGESQGMLACGFVMLDMVDPSRETDVVRGYSYRQIITRPILGGGFMTALAVPLINRIGLPAFTIAAAAVTVALIAWGLRRVGHVAQSAAE